MLPRNPKVFESIPREHFAELNRLQKLVGKNVELTLHAPIVEPTGLTKKGWDPFEREQAERQMFDAVEKAHDLNPKGNVVTTFHASAVSLPGETKIWEEKTIGGEKKKVPIIKEMYIIDERSGELSKMPLKPSAFEGKVEVEPVKELEKLNRANWYKGLQHVNFAVEQGASRIDSALKEGTEVASKINEKGLLGLYKYTVDGKGEKVDHAISALQKVDPGAGQTLKHAIDELGHGEIYIRDAYGNLRELYDQAYEALDRAGKKNELAKLDKFRKEMEPFIKNENYLKDPENLDDFKEKIRKGIHVLRSVEAPQVFQPFKKFAVDKSSDTFADVAYQSFKKFGDSSPIISIENPPAGEGIIYSGQDLKELIKASRKKFADKAVDKMGMSRDQAEREADKIIGATWDVGHINMIRKFGAGKKELLKEAEAIAPMVKHVHLSDNFGLEHTELPMGMGNVPTKETMKLVMEHNKKFKKIIEVGNWYQHFKTTPFAESLQHFNSPVYAMNNASYWGSQGGYFAGYGMNPEVHHSLYGAGFSNLPVELGGQMSGKSRVSGNPIE
jgi:hypothetical protein